jgi:hypothetical protein
MIQSHFALDIKLMAPLIELPVLDTSGYMPTDSSIAELKIALRLNHPQADTSGGRWISDEAEIIDSHDRQDEADAGDHILQLSLSDLQELEDAIQHFEGTAMNAVRLLADPAIETGLRLCKIQAANFPLPSLSSRIRKFSARLVADQPYFIIRGLKPIWFSKVKNIILYMGISSHVATKRAAAAGDPVVLRMFIWFLDGN